MFIIAANVQSARDIYWILTANRLSSFEGIELQSLSLGQWIGVAFIWEKFEAIVKQNLCWKKAIKNVNLTSGNSNNSLIFTVPSDQCQLP